MLWITPSEKDTDNAALEKRLWDAADQFRANSGLKSQEYSAPVLGLIFLRFAEVRFATHGLEGEIKHGGNINSYYDDPHDATGRFDFVLANGSMSSNKSGKGGITFKL